MDKTIIKYMSVNFRNLMSCIAFQRILIWGKKFKKD